MLDENQKDYSKKNNLCKNIFFFENNNNLFKFFNEYILSAFFYNTFFIQ